MRAILPFELKKLLYKKSTIGAIITVLLVVAGLFYMNFFVGQISGYSSDKVHGSEAVTINRQIAEEHSGYLSDDLISCILNDYAKNQPDFKKKGIYNVFSYYAIDALVPNASEILVEINNTDKVLQFGNIKLKGQKALGSHFSLKKLKLGNFASWNQLFLVSNSAYILILILSVYLSAPVFSGDSSKKMNSLLLTTRYGRNKLTVAKLTSSFLISMSLFVGFYALIIGVFAWYFGFSGGDTSVQLNLYWVNSFVNIMAFPEKMTLLATFINLVVFQFIGLIFIMGVNALISSKTKSPLTTFAISVGVILAPEFLLNIFRTGFLNKLFTILSVSTSNTPELLLKLAYDGFLGNFWANAVLVMLVRLALATICFGSVYLSIKKVSK